MGCGGSKDKEDQKKIKYEMKTTKVAAMDDFFKPVEEALKNAEEIREAVQDDKEEIVEICHTYLLKDEGDQMNVSSKIFFQALSAAHSGEVKKGKFEVEGEAPFLKVTDDQSIPADTNNLGQKLNNFFKACTTGPSKLNDIIKSLQEASGKVAELKNSDTSALSAGDKMTAMKNFGQNSSTLTNGLKKVQDLLPRVQAAASDMAKIGPKLKEYMTNADEVGKKAHENKKIKPSEIFEENYKEGVMTMDEYKQAQAEKDKKKKKWVWLISITLFLALDRPC